MDPSGYLIILVRMIFFDLPAYMHIYSVVNAYCLRLFEPSMIEDPEEQSQLPSFDDLLPKYISEL